MQYNVCGEISFKLNFDIEANCLEQASEKAKEIISDYYRIDVEETCHDTDSVDLALDIIEKRRLKLKK